MLEAAQAWISVLGGERQKQEPAVRRSWEAGKKGVDN